jgi:hypothetical protein
MTAWESQADTIHTNENSHCTTNKYHELDGILQDDYLFISSN